MRQITIEELQADTEAFVDAVENGETFIILRDGKPVVVMEPQAPLRDRPATR